MAVVNEHRIEVDGIPMRWLEAGAGVPVALVHGIPTSAELWRRVLPAVRGVRAMAWELVGYGDSIPAGRGRDIGVSRQAEYLLRATGIDRAILVGHDLGGGVVQIAAVERPELCAGLVLTNAIGYDGWPVWPVRLVRRLSGLVRRTPDPVLARVFGWVLRRMHDPAELGRASARIHWRHYARHGAGDALVRQVRSLDHRDTVAVADRLRELDVPARVVWGDRDPFFALEHGERTAAAAAGRLHVFDGAGHFLPHERPSEVARQIETFVTTVSP